MNADFAVGYYINILSSNLRNRVGELLDKNSHLDKILQDVEIYFRSNKDLLRELFYLRDMHRYTYEHSLNVAFYSLMIGMHNHLSDYELKVLCIGGILHDLGKIVVGKDILDKPGALTNEEFAVIKQHPQSGVVFFKNMSSSFDGRIQAVIGQHHEKLNGTGYPFGLHSNEIDDLSKIVTVADIFDAVTAKRSYHNSRTISEGMRILFESADKGELDAGIVSALVEAITYPVTLMMMQHDNDNIERQVG